MKTNHSQILLVYWLALSAMETKNRWLLDVSQVGRGGIRNW